ncbi:MULTISPECIES: transcriptional regulator NrdR [Fervidobacterium]|mgnify:CR=1 FL=1|uniref:Transcriptional repressor NrdR n=1 Tax=Fervidobacterium nodosum (strain ATCC 35602 / DSM 5306 / Rt17-B1) TaxID=381764 RepID=NRDR_FERNB|nr:MULTISPECIES: transcriptional regulator NrdR [Fervidobacterium]A7HM70.1 RecName: Full=Transcriptional repressor NrdR [Fervidobacterium nodosum Rt17-B1]PHJ14243.1 NrdR family transcriptional regulator [Fervidobacterium sp. SC_NGM5_G05]HOJ93996.1 transcriptional regulator NrdR [Fervidobacterium nodosum]ABS61003.1 ATP-cone domain protein [Fervidobacterium nodosum Rt17-B1]KAF2962329.1 NrdR family transcriptional regulator [Fervidobacterium sp. 2310opik-2]
MRCPFCGYEDTRVLDSRELSEGRAIRRRRECPQCHARFTTYERYETGPITVIKKDGRREKFDRKKILNGLLKAFEKRPITVDDMERIVDNIVSQLQKSGTLEVPSELIGKLVMEELRKVDQVAYVRFASVYKDFREIDQFIEVIKELRNEGQI